MKYAFVNHRADSLEPERAETLDIKERDLKTINKWLEIEECEIIPETRFREFLED